MLRMRRLRLSSMSRILQHRMKGARRWHLAVLGAAAARMVVGAEDRISQHRTNGDQRLRSVVLREVVVEADRMVAAHLRR